MVVLDLLAVLVEPFEELHNRPFLRSLVLVCIGKTLQCYHVMILLFLDSQWTGCNIPKELRLYPVLLSSSLLRVSAQLVSSCLLNLLVTMYPLYPSARVIDHCRKYDFPYPSIELHIAKFSGNLLER